MHPPSSGAGPATRPAPPPFETLLTDRLRVLGPPPHLAHPPQHRPVARQADDHAAIAFETLPTDQLRVLGADHPTPCEPAIASPIGGKPPSVLILQPHLMGSESSLGSGLFWRGTGVRRRHRDHRCTWSKGRVVVVRCASRRRTSPRARGMRPSWSASAPPLAWTAVTAR